MRPEDYTIEAIEILLTSSLSEDKKLSIVRNFKELLTDFGRYRVRRYLNLEGLRYFLEKLNLEINKEFKNE